MRRHSHFTRLKHLTYRDISLRLFYQLGKTTHLVTDTYLDISSLSPDLSQPESHDSKYLINRALEAIRRLAPSTSLGPSTCIGPSTCPGALAHLSRFMYLIRLKNALSFCYIHTSRVSYSSSPFTISRHTPNSHQAPEIEAKYPI